MKKKYFISLSYADSFWVALERDYAIRLQKPVYCLDPIKKTFTQDQAGLLELKVFPSYTRRDRPVIDKIVHLLKERYFDLFLDNSIPLGENWADSINNAIDSTLDAGGYSDRIIPCLIEEVSIALLPRQFQEYQVLNLYDGQNSDHINRN